MANDLDIRNPGALQPVAPSPVAPLSPGGNAPTNIDLLRGRELQPAQQVRQQNSPQVQTWFGTQLPPGTTEAQVDQMLQQMSALYMSDMSRLRFPSKYVNASISFIVASYGEDPENYRGESRRHNYNLGALASDPLAVAWANQMHRVAAPQNFIDWSIYWINELAKKVNGGAPAPATDGNSNYGDLDSSQYDEGTWNKIVAANEAAAVRTEIALRKKWGSSYQSNVALANSYLASLPPAQQKQLSRLTTGGVSGLNTVEVIEGMFQSAIGGRTIPKSGQGIASEIASIENVMRTNRRAYLKDENMQLRLRELYRLRDG